MAAYGWSVCGAPQKFRVRFEHAWQAMSALLERPLAVFAKMGLADEKIAERNAQKRTQRIVTGRRDPFVIDGNATASVSLVDVVIFGPLDPPANLPDLRPAGRHPGLKFYFY